MKVWREKGQGLTEYAMILVLVAVVVIVILAILGPAVGNVFSNIIVAIDPLILKPKMHVSDIAHGFGGMASVHIVDADGSSISGSTTVSGTCNDGHSDSWSGVPPVAVNCKSHGLPFCVTNITNPDYAYDSGANVETCGP